MKIYTIYKIQNKVTNKVYIGYTENFNSRMRQHKRKASKELNEKSKLYSAMKKYGIENFEFTIIYQSKDRDYCKLVMENYFICMYDSYNTGYNMTLGGEGVDSESNSKYSKIRWQSEEYRKLMDEKRMPAMQTEEYKQNQSNIMTEMWTDPEYRNSVAEGVKQYWSVEENRIKNGGSRQ